MPSSRSASTPQSPHVYPSIIIADQMGFLRKVIGLSTVVLLAAFVWQWSCSVDIKGEHQTKPATHAIIRRPFCMVFDVEFYRGKRVILTGASRGIGKSLAIQLAQLGAK